MSGSVRTFKTLGKVFLDMDRPRPGNNIFIFLLSFTSGKCMKNRHVNQECFYCGAWRVHWWMSKTVNVIPNTEKSFWKRIWCRERSGILLRGPDRKKPDRLAANQSARFARILDRKKINTTNSYSQVCLEIRTAVKTIVAIMLDDTHI